jgi:hypothetical protein
MWRAIFLLPTVTAALVANDFLVAAPTTPERRSTTNAGLLWRTLGGATVPAVYVISPHAASHYHDANLTHFANQTKPRDVRFGYRLPGDYRYAHAPLTAHAWKKYKWMLYGDDDTMWIMDSVARFLEPFDHTIPVMLSDNFWKCMGKTYITQGARVCYDRNQDVPRCSPCHGPLVPGLARGCPCRTPQDACAASLPPTLYWRDGIEKNFSYVPEKCIAGEYRYHHYGGAGLILSVAAVEELVAQKEEYNKCVLKYRSRGSESTFEFKDFIAGRCIQDTIGLGYTEPGLYPFAFDRHPSVDSLERTVRDEGRTNVVSVHLHCAEDECEEAARRVMQATKHRI